MKKYNIYYIILLLMFAFIGSCTKTEYYIGAYEDFTHIKPIHESLILNSNNIFISNFERYNENSKCVKLDSTEYIINENYIHVRDYTKNLASPHDIKNYVKGIPSPIDSNELLNKLLNNSWNTTSTDLIINNDFDIKTNLTFNKNATVNQQRIYKYNNKYIHHENEILEYNIVPFYNSLILLLTNPNTGQKFPALQVKYSNDDEIVFNHARELTTMQDTFTVIGTKENYKRDENLISYCNYNQNEYYYGDRASNNLGSEGILKYSNSIKRNKNKSEHGFITINFSISCKNEIGKFGLELLDSSFERTEFSYELIKAAFQTVKKLKWSINKNNVQYKINDEIHAFLTFKIENGEITDVTP